MSGHRPWSEIKHKSTPEQRERARAELDQALALGDKACVECGRPAERFYSNGVGELVGYCQACAAREFGSL